MNPTPDPPPEDSPGLSVLILATTGRDAELCARMIRRHGISCEICSCAADLVARIENGEGPAVFAAEDMKTADASRLERALQAQPDWSDVPMVILSKPTGPPVRLQAVAERPSSTLLHRPIKADTFVTVVRAAVESRLRQYRVRDLLGRLENRAKQLQSLAVELGGAEDRERRRIAEILHDDLQQILVGANFHLGICADKSQTSGENDILNEVSDLLREAISKTRELSHQLSPPVLWESGLVAALKWLAERMEQMHGLSVGLNLDKRAEPSQDALKPFLFRCAQELLFNVVKHAGTNRAELRLAAEDGSIRLCVQDEGCGFAADSSPGAEGNASFGLFSIRERADRLGGSLEIDSRPGVGSTFTLFMPHGVERMEVRGRYQADSQVNGLARENERPL